MLAALTAGFFLGASLIIAIGSQNAFVLRQGLRGEHVALICLTCALSDALLIMAGVLGYGARLLQPVFARPMAWRILDVGIGLVMLLIAASLVL